MPHDLPDWQPVYHYFAKWKKDGTWRKLNEELRRKVRKKEGHEEEPTAGILDSQSVKTMQEAETKGYDARKKIKGRKRHLLVRGVALGGTAIPHAQKGLGGWRIRRAKNSSRGAGKRD